MIPFFGGSLIGFIAVYVIAGAVYFGESHGAMNQPWGTLALLMILLPASAQTLVAELTARALRKRHFNPRYRASYTLAFIGLACAGLAVAGTMFALPFTGATMGDAWTVGLCAATAPLAVVPFMPRKRAHHCEACDYELSINGGAHAHVRCPECGEPTLA